MKRGMNTLSELLKYRELVMFMVINDLKVRYRGSFLGLIWTVLSPILMTCVLWIVFSSFGRIEEKNYALFLLSGLMVWTFFTQSITQSLSSIIKNRNLMQQIYVPKIVFPITMIVSNTVNFLFFLVAYVFIAIFTEVGLSTTIFNIIPALIVTCVLATGCGLAIAALNVFFRDFTHLTDVVLRGDYDDLGFWGFQQYMIKYNQYWIRELKNRTIIEDVLNKEYLLDYIYLI